jgi:hypothetical protein
MADDGRPEIKLAPVREPAEAAYPGTGVSLQRPKLRAFEGRSRDRRPRSGSTSELVTSMDQHFEELAATAIGWMDASAA